MKCTTYWYGLFGCCVYFIQYSLLKHILWGGLYWGIILIALGVMIG